MRSDIERAIIHYYPERALANPAENAAITWSYDADHAILKAVLGDLQAIDAGAHPGSRGANDLSEEVVLGELHLQLSYLGPWAALNHALERDLSEDEREMARRIERALQKHGIEILSTEDLAEPVRWIRHGAPDGEAATVWSCLFVSFDF